MRLGAGRGAGRENGRDWPYPPVEDNGNSFDSCFQFESQSEINHLHIRVKYYWKFLAFVQSESVQKAIGMNTKAIFYPNVRMGLALNESQTSGLSRIEITFTANTVDGENTLLTPFFRHYSEVCLN